MRIRINGKEESVAAGTTVAAYLASRGLDARRVAVEINMSIIQKDAYHDTTLNPDDTVEIVHFVGGG